MRNILVWEVIPAARNKTKLNDYSMRLVLKCVEYESIIEESKKIRVKREEHR